jgi:hypothetical protein
MVTTHLVGTNKELDLVKPDQLADCQERSLGDKRTLYVNRSSDNVSPVIARSSSKKLQVAEHEYLTQQKEIR